MMDLDEFLKENNLDEEELKRSMNHVSSPSKDMLPDSHSLLPHNQSSNSSSATLLINVCENEVKSISPASSYEDSFQEADSSIVTSSSSCHDLTDTLSQDSDKRYLLTRKHNKKEPDHNHYSDQKLYEDDDQQQIKDVVRRQRGKLCRLPPNPSTNFSENNSIVSPLHGHEEFDPSSRVFSDDELKPQQIVKKSKKQQFVPHDMKDERYWARRHKNNVAAKRSRDARRIKENQIAMRARYLERENQSLTMELEKMQTLLEKLKKRLSAYETP